MRRDKNLFYKYLAQTSPFPLALEIVKAKGSYLYDSKGNKFLDFISGISVSNIGHGHQKVINAIKKQASQYMHLMVYGEYVQAPQVRLAEKICTFLPHHLNTVYYVNSGAEAVEGAIKLAKIYTGRHEIISFKNAYHGSTHGALSLMGNEKLKEPYRPLLPGIKFIEFNNLIDLDKISSKTAAVIVEVIQGEAGIIMPEIGYLKLLEKLCKKYGTLLIVDEIQTGMGRTGKMFGFEHFGISPDIITLAKAFGGGMPLGAFISSKEIMGCFCEPPLGHITTFGGHPVCCAAALAALNILVDKKIINDVAKKGHLIKENLKSEGFNVGGLGLFLSIHLGHSDLNFGVIKKCIEKGLIVDWFLFADNKIRIAPPLTITNKEINYSCKIIKESIREVLAEKKY